MARTTSNAVKGVLRSGSEGGDYDDVNEPSLLPYIETATVIVDRVAACAVAKSITLSSAEKELIERWLAAHCYGMSDQTAASESTAGASANYHGETGLNLDGTKYGQMAQSLDYSGCLAAIGKRQFATAAWLGKPPSSQIDYRDRD